MRRNGAGILLGAVGVWLGLTGAAKAEPSIDTRTFRPSTDPAANLVLEPTSTPGPWNFHAAAFASYANGPITLRNAGTDDVAYRPVLHLLGMDLVELNPVLDTNNRTAKLGVELILSAFGKTIL